MGSSSARLADPEAIADFLHRASLRLGISLERLTLAIRASQILSNDELEVLTSLVVFAQSGASPKKRSAVAMGLVTAINTVREAHALTLSTASEER